MELVEFLDVRLVILVPMLWVLGKAVKVSDLVEDRYIPVLLLIPALAGAVGLSGANAESVVQGVIATGLAVYGNQVVKQLGEGK